MSSHPVEKSTVRLFPPRRSIWCWCRVRNSSSGPPKPTGLAQVSRIRWPNSLSDGRDGVARLAKPRGEG
ncbi:Uncharacterized protein APZ42_031907 [Daphnia magna]|uniref:Uncharacterized protein n=1 Tax=Daphnia magna TaxID=35525 RepID=A0A164MCY1_9CRUS|nr:Uncharacterized protein APZ42_031907 [Daphnia magna]